MILKFRFVIVICVLSLTLLGNFWGKHTAAPTAPKADYLQNLPLPYRGWQVSEQHLTEHEKELLIPDAVILREYRSPEGEVAQLAVLAGHRKQTVHTPAFCMAGGGWNTLFESNLDIRLGEDVIPATKAIMENSSNRLMMIYFFTNGDKSLRSLSKFQFEQFKNRLYGKIQQGALIRVIVPILKDQKASEILSEDFFKSVIPDILKQIKLENKK